MDFYLTRSLVSSYSSGVREEGDEQAPMKPVQSWVDVYLPEMERPYALLARLDKPIGTRLLAWPCMWYVSCIFIIYEYISEMSSEYFHCILYNMYEIIGQLPWQPAQERFLI
jgi:hypothetical protein